MELKTGDHTLSTVFLLPGIGHKRRDLLDFGFLNAYLDDVDHDIKYKNGIYLLFKPQYRADINRLINLEQQSPHFIEDYDYEGGYTVLVYRFNPKYAQEYELFQQGKYSKFSKEYKGLFSKFVTVRDPESGKIGDTLSLPYHVFNKTEALREYREEKLGVKLEELGVEEYWSSPTIETETLDINKIRNNKSNGK